MYYRNFYVYTTMVCYSCRRYKVVRLKQSWRDIHRVGQEKEALDVVLVSCPTCLDYPHVHNPLKAAMVKYLDVQLYLNIIEALGREYKCTPTIFEEKKFSFRAWRIKPFTQVKDVSKVVHLVTPLEAYITMFEKEDGFRFLRQNPILPPHKIIRYPSIDLTQNSCSILSSSGVNNLVMAQLYLTCLEDAPPSYTTVGSSKEVPVISIEKGTDSRLT
jgi:hypothetical protein